MQELNGGTPGFRVECQGGLWVAALMGVAEWIGDTLKFDTRDELVAALVEAGLIVHDGGGIYSA